MSLCLSRVCTTGALSVTIVSSSIQPTAPAFVAGLHTPGSLGSRVDLDLWLSGAYACLRAHATTAAGAPVTQLKP